MQLTLKGMGVGERHMKGLPTVKFRLQITVLLAPVFTVTAIPWYLRRTGSRTPNDTKICR